MCVRLTNSAGYNRSCVPAFQMDAPFLTALSSSAIGSLTQLPLLFTLSLLVWVTEIGRLAFVIHALDIGSILPLSVIILVTLASSILTTIPLTPGGLGLVEPGVLGLLVISLPRSDALSIVLLDRSISYLSIILVGGLFFLLHHTKHAK